MKCNLYFCCQPLIKLIKVVAKPRYLLDLHFPIKHGQQPAPTFPCRVSLSQDLYQPYRAGRGFTSVQPKCLSMCCLCEQPSNSPPLSQLHQWSPNQCHGDPRLWNKIKITITPSFPSMQILQLKQMFLIYFLLVAH